MRHCLGLYLVYAFYAEDITAYPLAFRVSEQQDEDDPDHDNNYDLTREIVPEPEEEVSLPANIHLFDS